MERPLISVVVPVYKVEKYLDKCVSSIAEQTYKNIEIILVDDGSPDNCPAICDDWAKKDQRVKVVHKKNGGLSSARNAGVKVALGEYIGFIDSDDYIVPHMYETLANAVLENGADLAVCGMRWINEDGSRYENVCESPIKDEVLDRNGAFLKLNTPDSFFYVTAVNKLYKRSIFDKVSFPEGKINEDEFSIHHVLGQCSKVVSIKEELYFYVQRQNSIMHSEFSIRRLDIVDAFFDRYDYLRKEGINSVTYFTLYQAYYVLMTMIRTADVYKYRKEFSPYVRRMFFSMLPNLRAVRLLLEYTLRYARGIAARLKGKIKSARIFSKRDKKNGNIVIVATPTHGNLGDQAIVSAEYGILSKIYPKKTIIEVPNELYIRYPEMCEKYVKENDIIIIDGGGNMGTLWPHEDDKIADIIERFKNNKTVVFPQTCYYDPELNDVGRIEKNKKAYYSASDLTILLRDRRSYEFVCETFPEAKAVFVPDIVLSLKPEISSADRSRVLVCLREDCEAVVPKEIAEKTYEALKEQGIEYFFASTVIPEGVDITNRQEKLMAKWKQFSESSFVITDRLHAMIFALITGTPCIAVDNKSKKVGGVYEWIKDLSHVTYLDDPEQMPEAVKRFVKELPCVSEYSYPVEMIEKVFK